MKKINQLISNSPQAYSIFVLLLLAITWGSSYIMIKKALIAFEPLQVGFLRITVSALAFLPLFLWKFKKIDWKKWHWLLIVGLTGSGIPALLFPFAQTYLSSSLTGVMSSLTPLFTLILGILFFRSPVVWKKIVGIILGLFGALVLVYAGNKGDFSGNIWFSIAVVAATACYGLSSNIVATKLKGMGALTISATSFFMIGIPGIIGLSMTGAEESFIMHPEGHLSLYAILFLSLAGTVMASILFYKLVQMTSAVFASTVSYIIPIVAISIGFWDGEMITLLHFLGMGLILGGVYLSRN